MDKKYKVAVLLIALQQAWKQLIDETKQLPDLDLTDCYPFGYSDFETDLYERVTQWCTLNSNRLISECPLMVVNPDCLLYCKDWAKADVALNINKDGYACTKAPPTGCTRYPLVPFDAELILAALKKVDKAPAVATPDAIYDAYADYVNLLRKPNDEK